MLRIFVLILFGFIAYYIAKLIILILKTKKEIRIIRNSRTKSQNMDKEKKYDDKKVIDAEYEEIK